jgi:oligopeptide/dipeptide ABC transporter ATP-binding protein
MTESIIKAEHLTKHYAIKKSFFKTLLSKENPVVHAVDDISFQIGEEEIFGLAGESGCGKTTTGKLLLRLIQPTSGKIYFKGKDITNLTDQEMRKTRQKIQVIFQDPYESLNPRMSIYDIISEPVHVQKAARSLEEIKDKVTKVMEDMDLVPPEEFLYRFPHELSGGQRQRVAIARAFILQPQFIVADEPVSMLDASIRSEVAKLILSLVEKFHISFLYITHDIALARYMCNRIAVMYLGRIVEMGPTDDVIQNPFHPYTEALIAAVPVPDPTVKRTEIVLKGEIPSAVNPPSGCRFHTRCMYAQDICKKEEPKLVESGKNRYFACYFPLGK